MKLDANRCDPGERCENCATPPRDQHLYAVGYHAMRVCRACYVACAKDAALRIQFEFSGVDLADLSAWLASRTANPMSLPWSLYDDATEALSLDFYEDQQ